nr:putative dipeptidyl peptidase 3 [Quercus suber]
MLDLDCPELGSLSVPKTREATPPPEHNCVCRFRARKLEKTAGEPILSSDILTITPTSLKHTMSESYHPRVGATVHQLRVKPVFDALTPREKLYAHYLARAAWHGSRIVMRQVSSESTAIFDFILNLYKACDGQWERLAQNGVNGDELTAFLEYAAMFLCNLGNFYGEGDQKFVPNLTREALEKLASVSEETEGGLSYIIDQPLAVPPYNLDYLSHKAQSGYYPGRELITPDEVAMISNVMNEQSIGLENTRLRKSFVNGEASFQLLQASVDKDRITEGGRLLAQGIALVRGDHSDELAKVCAALEEAKEHAENDKQSRFLAEYIKYFRTGDLGAFQRSQKLWVTDVADKVENIIGFIEPYRDPAGVRAE